MPINEGMAAKVPHAHENAQVIMSDDARRGDIENAKSPTKAGLLLTKG
jgi:hypothetical protein